MKSLLLALASLALLAPLAGAFGYAQLKRCEIRPTSRGTLAYVGYYTYRGRNFTEVFSSERYNWCPYQLEVTDVR